MARLTRLVVAGHPHLILQRGNNRQPVFIDADDLRFYLEALREVARVHSVSIHAYALAANESMLLATPATAEGISKMMQSLGRRYVGAFNKRHGRTGTLFEGRFRTTVIESAEWFWRCMVFVESAPSRQPSAIEASSAPHHMGQGVDPLIWEHADFWRLGNTPFEREAAYKLLLEQGLDSAAVASIFEAADKGWPLGTDRFLGELAQATTRRLVPLKKGRRGRKEQPGPN